MIPLRKYRYRFRPYKLVCRAKPKPRSSQRKRTSQSVGRHWFNKPAVIYRSEREICNPATPEGKAEYKWRILLMWVRQEGLCCDCREPLRLKEATFEHENGRGGGKRDDRIAIYIEGKFIRHQNGAAHLWCNSQRGSRRTPIWHGNNCIVEDRTRTVPRGTFGI